MDVPLDIMSILSTTYWYTGIGVNMVFSPMEVMYLNDRERRIKKFKEIVSQAKNIKLLLVPYMETLEEKANLYKEYK
ncbi:hypothetical protein [Arcobacter sp. AHV-9/2010]|uniref:hypothetical protein n=1 Tax=Arcobacter sp. AHV-9/2010 TaxID=2021861 RepID=UPI00100AEB07|nr:hypothetical protein [Arcobacter sp. CECT 9299]